MFMNNETLAERFWSNVVMLLRQEKKSFAWLEKEAALPKNYLAASISKGLKIRLNKALKISHVMNKSLELLMYGRFELRIPDGRKHEKTED